MTPVVGALSAVLLILLIPAVAAAVIGALLGRPVDRQRFNRFAERQVLAVTPTNAAVVARALAVTHRWRRFGLVAGFALAALWSLQQNRLSVDFGAMFLGWFVGAVIAEWRISAPSGGGTRRRANLSVRTLASYVTAPNRAVLWGTLALVALAAGWAGVLDLPDPTRRADWLVAATQCLVGAGVLWAVTRRVVGRPRPGGAARGVLDADDALRGHSLTVLTGSAVALASLPLAGFAESIVGSLAGAESAALAGTGIVLAGVVAGWTVATRTVSSRRAATAGGRP